MTISIGTPEFFLNSYPIEQFGGVYPSWLLAMADAYAAGVPDPTGIDVFASPEDFQISPLRESVADVPYSFNSPPVFEPRGTGGGFNDRNAIIIGSRQTHGFPQAVEPGTVGMPTRVGGQPLAFTPTASTPGFVGGRIGRVRFTPIGNRQITGVRVGTLPQVVFDDYAPNASLGDFRVIWPGGGGTAVLEP